MAIRQCNCEGRSVFRHRSVRLTRAQFVCENYTVELLDESLTDRVHEAGVKTVTEA